MGLDIDSLVKYILHLLALEEQEEEYFRSGKEKGKMFFLDFQAHICPSKKTEVRGETRQVVQCPPRLGKPRS